MELIESRVPMVAAFSANKGGVGKTRQAILTANCLGAAGKRVLVIDMDFNNSATFYYLPDDRAGAAREKTLRTPSRKKAICCWIMSFQPAIAG